MKYFVHTVREGEDLHSVARKYAVSEREIARDNNIAAGEKLFCGMKLAIVRRDGEYYIVKPFDTLQSIAAAHGVDPDKLAALNGIEGGAVFLGQSIYIEK